MYSFTLKFKKTNKIFKDHNEVEAAIREISGSDVVDNFLRELAHCIAQGCIVNRSHKQLHIQDTDTSFFEKTSVVDAAFTLFSKTLSNLKMFQDIISASSHFKSIVASLSDAGWEVTTSVGQETDEFFVYGLETALVSDTHLEQ
jgi:hypothetical protein